MRKLPALGLGLVVATTAVVVMAKSATSTITAQPVPVLASFVDQIHSSIDVASLRVEEVRYDQF